MGRRIAAWTLLTFCSVTSSAWALTADDYVVAARTALFERTTAGLAQAGALFDAAEADTTCPDCANDRELIFLRAVARTAMLFVDHNDVLAAEGFFQLAETLGIPLDGMAFYSTESEGAEEDARAGTTETTVEQVQQTLRETVLPQLDSIVSDLDAVGDEPDPFVVYFVPEETGLTGDLEVDHGDVLILKGLLSAYKGLLALQFGDEPNAAGLLDGGAAGQDVLSRAVALLAEPDEEGASLARARTDWIAALTSCIAAAEYIAGEDSPAGTDPQADEFVYVDADAQRRLEAYRQMLATLRNCLVAGAEATADVRTYRLRSANSTWLGELALRFDLQGVSGSGGRLVLADGTALEIDWFGTLDDDRIGVSLFSGDQGLEGWLEVSLNRDLGLIHDGTLELWGRRSVAVTGVAGQVVATNEPLTRIDASTLGPLAETVGSDARIAEEWLSVESVLSYFNLDGPLALWFEPLETPLPVSRL